MSGLILGRIGVLILLLFFENFLADPSKKHIPLLHLGFGAGDTIVLPVCLGAPAESFKRGSGVFWCLWMKELQDWRECRIIQKRYTRNLRGNHYPNQSSHTGIFSVEMTQ